jgi:hypothetical protein
MSRVRSEPKIDRVNAWDFTLLERDLLGALANAFLDHGLSGSNQ